MFTYACSPTVEHREASSSRVGQYAPFPDPTGDMLGLTTGSTKDLTRLIIRAFLGDADGEMGKPRAAEA